jgi:hypothetical protein
MSDLWPSAARSGGCSEPPRPDQFRKQRRGVYAIDPLAQSQAKPSAGPAGGQRVNYPTRCKCKKIFRNGPLVNVLRLRSAGREFGSPPRHTKFTRCIFIEVGEHRLNNLKHLATTCIKLVLYTYIATRWAVVCFKYESFALRNLASSPQPYQRYRTRLGHSPSRAAPLMLP